MASLLNNDGVQYYSTQMVKAENRKVNGKPLPSVLNEIDVKLDEMKTLFDEEYGTALDMKLENNENVFSVGTGTNVDKRSEVENSFTDVELSGNSLVNLVTTKGDNLFGISGYGVTFNRAYNTDLTRCIYTTQEETGNYITIRTGSKERIKSNTTYTLIFNIFKNNISELQKGISIRGSNDPYYTQAVGGSYFNIYTDSSFNITSGIKVISFTTGDNANKYTGFGFGFPSVKTNVAGQQFEIGDVVLLEGDYTNKPIPQYFKGMKSVGQDDVNGHKIEILSQNKNLWNVEVVKKQDGVKPSYTKNNNIITYSEIGEYGIYVPIKVKKGEALRISGIVKNVQNIRIFREADNFVGMGIYNRDYNGIETEVSPHYICTFPEDGVYHIRVWCKNTGTPILTDFLAEISSANTTYVEHKSNKKEILLNEPLRALSDEVKDSIEKINGEWKIVRRCGEIVLNGSENWGTSGMTPQENTLIFQGDVISQLVKPNSSAKSDKFATYNGATTDAEGLLPFSGTGGTRIYFRISKSKLSSQDVAGFKQWLSENPTKVIYELVTPIIEDISPITLQCWKNGTISIDEVLPVESTHTVALNKPAQIKRNIEELTTLRNKVQALEENYDQIALEQAHQLSLLNHSIELDYDI